MPPKPSFASRLRAAFSLRGNLAGVAQRSGDALAPLDGLRAIAVLWVMVFHCLSIPTIHWASAGNMVRFLDAPALNVVFSGHMGVEIFLVLSGFLMGHVLLREALREGTIRYGAFVRRRWIRVVPVYAAAIAAHMITDPGQRASCARDGWANLLFLNNFAGEQLNVRSCLMHTWSIAVEFHLYLISPFVVRWMLARRGTFGGVEPDPDKRWGLLPPVILIALGTAASSAIVLRHHEEPLGLWYLTVFCNKTYARATPFLAGLVAAYLYHRAGPRSPSRYRLVTHALALGLVAVIAYLGAGEHPSRYLPGAVDLHPHRDLFLLLFARQLLGLGIAVLLYQTVTGAAPLAGRFLSAAIWVPLARLSYAAYLVEFMVMIPLYPLWSRHYATAATLSDLAPAMATNVLVAVVASFVAALPFFVLVEKPFVNLR